MTKKKKERYTSSVYELNSTLAITKERIGELEERAEEITWIASWRQKE